MVDSRLQRVPAVTEMATFQKRQVLYSATTPLDGSASLSKASHSTNDGSRGLVPYFVSCVTPDCNPPLRTPGPGHLVATIAVRVLDGGDPRRLDAAAVSVSPSVTLARGSSRGSLFAATQSRNPATAC